MSHREPSFARAGGPHTKHQRMAAQRANIRVLRGGARPHRTLAQVDLLEGHTLGRRLVVEQRALRYGKADRSLDIAGDKLVAMLEPVIQAFEHAPRLFHAVARSRDADVVAPLVGNYLQPALDQGEVLAVLAEQRGGQSVVVECEHEGCCCVTARRHRRGRDRSVVHSRRSQRCQSPAASASRASAPNMLFELTSVIVTAATWPIRLCGAMT